MSRYNSKILGDIIKENEKEIKELKDNDKKKDKEIQELKEKEKNNSNKIKNLEKMISDLQAQMNNKKEGEGEKNENI